MPRYAVVTLAPRATASIVEICDAPDDLVAARLILEPYGDWIFVHRVMKCLDDFGPICDVTVVDDGSGRTGRVIGAIESAGCPTRKISA